MTNAINWFEIPVADMDRAQAFYEKVLGRKLKREDFGGETMAVFPYDEPASGGCLIAGGQRAAGSGSGIRIYLDCMPGIDAALSRVVAAGGQIVAPKTALPTDMGFFAHLRDTEGNEVGLHALA
jgi:hypothetical protein